MLKLWWRTLRLNNLLMLFFVQWIVSQFFVKDFSWIHLLFISGATILIALAANLLNDVEDISLDLLNGKQGLVNASNSKKTEVLSYLLMFLGIVLGYFASSLAKLEYFFFFPLAALLLWLYAKYLSRFKFLSNFIISGLISLAILLAYYLEVEHESYQRKFDTWDEFAVLVYAAFAFIYNWIREVVKDMEDEKGDALAKRISLAKLMGKTLVKALLSICFLALIASLLIFVSLQEQIGKFNLIYILNLVILQFLALVLLIGAKSKKNYNNLSSLIKLLMLLGLIIPILVQ